MSEFTLPWPPASLSGHNNGNHFAKATIIKKHRSWAKAATLAAKPIVLGEGDIVISVTFIPPNDRSDRLNFTNRMKPYFDGIADGLKVNDKRFLPEYHYRSPEKPGGVIVRVG